MDPQSHPARSSINQNGILTDFEWVFLGVLYFGDDDNTYDLRLFDEIRDTQNISMFPVGLVGDYAVSAPVVANVSRHTELFPNELN